MKARIAILPGDGVGPEIVAEAVKALRAVERRFGHDFELAEHPVGGAAHDLCGDCLPDSTLDACRRSDATLLGAVGGPKWDSLPPAQRPERRALLTLRAELGLFANLRPAKVWDALKGASPLKDEIVARGIDLLIVRELTGGAYFGEKGRSDGGRSAYDVTPYSRDEIERVARIAFEAARGRAKGRMQLVRDPARFDVILTENMFGDILSDEASQITGSIGMLPSASMGAAGNGLYEPIHGSAPDIAGRGVANPLATVLSAAMMLRHAFGLHMEADVVERAVASVLAAGLRTADIAPGGSPAVSTSAIGDAVTSAIGELE